MFSILSRAKLNQLIVAPPPPDPLDVVWEGTQGIYAKIEQNQFDSYQAGGSLTSSPINRHLPEDYLTRFGNNNFPKSVYYELLHYKWLRGIQIDLDWGLIETNASTRNWDRYDKVFEIVNGIGTKGLNGQNKKILFLITWKTFDRADATRCQAVDLQSHVGTPYSTAAAGPLTIGTAPNEVNIDMIRYDHLWGYASTTHQPGNEGYGYHFRFADFRAAATGNDFNGDPIATFANRYKAFLTAVYARYKDNPAFAGFLTIEPSPLTPCRPTLNEYNETNHFNGRLELLQWMRNTFTKHMMVEAPNHNNAWMTRMTGDNATEGCVAKHLGFTGPNMHTGTNLQGLYNARKNIKGVCPYIVQCQPQDMKSMSGNISTYWRFDTDPPDFGGIATAGPTQGQPNTSLTATPTLNDDPITTGDWVILRSRYLGGNILSYQRNIGGGNPFDWNRFVQYMQTETTLVLNGVLITNDEYGGMIPTKPTFVV